MYLLIGIFIISYIVTGYVVGSNMHKEGFAGSKNFVTIVGGAFWPMTGIMLLFSLFADYETEFKLNFKKREG